MRRILILTAVLCLPATAANAQYPPPDGPGSQLWCSQHRGTVIALAAHDRATLRAYRAHRTKARRRAWRVAHRAYLAEAQLVAVNC